ncbi:hypothetical protein RQP53_14325 [Paucibacter sp. APW11]|uniref:Type I restriction endonuclease subunit M n=1 Tax=Roseateles aquae TaxID=3077235 RepID=A0ABU3PEB8_9BURK|nr:hypothetical protein [Paucibacter sp. APW11]MDT9000448.1 hypothetical protein [Paucibacter sp. APW11]
MSTSTDGPRADADPQLAGTSQPTLPRLELGQLVSTPGALKLLMKRGVSPISLLARHARGDWGQIPAEDARSNREALIQGFRVMSSYALPDGGVIWVITEADRSVTTCLLPSEY